MEGMRCSVESWAAFGLLKTSDVKLILAETEVVFSTGRDEVLIFSGTEKRVQDVLQFDSPVSHLTLCKRRLIYALCENDGVYCVSFPQQSRSVTEDEDPIVHRVTEESILLRDKTVVSFYIIDDILITVSQDTAQWRLCLYRTTDGKHVSLRKLAEHRISSIYTDVPQRNSKSVEHKDAGSSVRHPVLTCVYPSGGASFAGDTSRSPDYLLDPVLFSLLFSVDAALLNSPVVLCGLPDGRVCYLPLLLPVTTAASSPEEQRTALRVLHSLEQPIAFIGTAVATETGGGVPRSLVVIGQTGRVLQLTANEHEGEGKMTGFNEFRVRGPVVCACTNGSHVYYSTGSDLLALKMSVSSPSSSSSSSNQTGPPDSLTPLPVSLKVSRVIAMTPTSGDPTTEDGVELLALTQHGKLQKIRVPQLQQQPGQGGDRGSAPRMPASVAGQRVKDLLAGIGNVWERASALKNSVEQRNSSLKLLNQVLNISIAMLSNQKTEDQSCDGQQPIRCRGVTSWTRVLQEESLMLTCTLENNSGFVLERGWFLCIHVHPASSSPAAETKNPSRTYTFPLQKLETGREASQTLPLGTTKSLSLPLTVYCSLMFSTCSIGSPEEPQFKGLENTGLVQQRPSTLTALTPSKDCVCLPLNTLTVDALDAFQLDTAASVTSTVSRQQLSTTATMSPDPIHALLVSRGMEVDGDLSKVRDQRSQPYAAVVKISAECLRARLKDIGSSAAPETRGQEPCLAALRWLLSGDGVRTERGLLEPLQTPMVMGHGPTGCSAKISVKEVTMSDVYVSGPLSVLEVHIESFSLEMVCGLHHAVLQRIQSLVNGCRRSQEPHVRLREESLRQAVQRAEALHKALQEALAPTALGISSTSHNTTHKLLSIYQQLRDNPLLVL
ncbi:Fanconi anemia core complex-associated protein 100 [Engraulis encrasicolus]|uniref:Fanconi anemia core complex-associated protein 100 n=1 Tax=Engraulis encrasicolus TaxID=184585 RepID=UPI002FD10CE7